MMEKIDANRIFKDSDDRVKFMDKFLQKYDDHPSIYFTGNFYRYFRNFKRMRRSEHGKGTIEFNKILEYDGENCYTPSGMGCFLESKNYIFNKDFSTE